MNKSLDYTQTGKINAQITISGSKSQSNRALILQQLFPYFTIQNLSNADDTAVLQHALQQTSERIDIHHAGTAMRFLTAFFAVQAGKQVVLTGSERMQQRPIGKLVDVLTDLGAAITYLDQPNFPPIQITGKKLASNKVSIDASQSSQFVSALLLIAPVLENGLELELTGLITSAPYIKMTLNLLNQLGVRTEWNDNLLRISAFDFNKNCTTYPEKIVIESDWSSASYFYNILAFAEIGSTITLAIFQENSLQADSIIAELYQNFGVATQFEFPYIILKKTSKPQCLLPFSYDFTHCPDITQTVAVTCFGLGISAHFTGLHTLKIKETDRITALKNELEKMGATVTTTDDSLAFQTPQTLNRNVIISTYNDHRMALAFAGLSLKVPIEIENAEVVSKSYPDFWQDFEKLLQ